MPKGEDAAFRTFVECANSGKSWAQSRLGHVYLQHRLQMPFTIKNPPLDKKKGLQYIKLAADQNETNALYALGQFYHEGMNGVKKDKAKAKQMFEMASNTGHTKAQTALGAIYCQNGGRKNILKAVRYFTLAYNKDETAQAALFFGQLYYRGDGGFRKSLLLANHYFGETAKKGEKRVYLSLTETLGSIHHQYYHIPLPGHNVMPLSMYWARQAAAAGYPEGSRIVDSWQQNMSNACFNLSKCKTKSSVDDGKKCCAKCKAVWYCSKECQGKQNLILAN